MTQLSPDDHRRLHSVIAAAEKRTSAHLAVVVIPLSDRYLLFPPLWAAAFALAVGGALAIHWPHLPLRTGFLIEAIALAGFVLIFDWFPLRLLLVPRRIKREHCVGLARREFAVRILADHKHRPGVLLFVSLGERHIEVLADRALHDSVGEGAWDRVVADFVAASNSRRPVVEGLFASIEACAAILETHYPSVEGDVC